MNIKKTNYYKVYTAYIAALVSSVLLGVIFPLFSSANKNHLSAWKVLANILLALFAAFLSVMIYRLYSTVVIVEKCDVKTQRQLLEKSAGKRITSSLRLLTWIKLTGTYFLLGEYTEMKQKLGELNKWLEYSDKKNRAKILYLNALYWAETGIREQYEEYKKAFLEQTNLLTLRQKSQVSEIESYIKTIEIYDCLLQEDWEALRAFCTANRERAATISSEISFSYLSGISHLRLGEMERAVEELSYVIEKGGDLKYVKQAKQELAAVSLVPLQKVADIKTVFKSNKKKMGLLCGLWVLAIGGILFNYRPVYYSDISSAYCSKYFFQGQSKELITVYMEEAEGYGIGILEDEENIIYCLYERQNESYRIRRMYELGKTLIEFDSTSMPNLSNEDIEFFKNNILESHVRFTLRRFYKGNPESVKQNLPCIIVEHNPTLHKVCIGEIIPKIKEVNQKGKIWYIGRFEGVDYETAIEQTRIY